MKNPASALQEIRDQYYLDPDAFREMLHTDPNVLHEEERMYLTKLAVLEADIIAAIEAWSNRFGNQVIMTEDWSRCALLLAELNGPLSKPASEMLVNTIQNAFSADLVRKLPPPFCPVASKPNAVLIWLPRVLLAIALLLFVLAKFMSMDSLYAFAAIIGSVGAIWMYLRA
jgi:hypothetical protein